MSSVAPIPSGSVFHPRASSSSPSSFPLYVVYASVVAYAFVAVFVSEYPEMLDEQKSLQYFLHAGGALSLGVCLMALVLCVTVLIGAWADTKGAALCGVIAQGLFVFIITCLGLTAIIGSFLTEVSYQEGEEDYFSLWVVSLVVVIPLSSAFTYANYALYQQIKESERAREDNDYLVSSNSNANSGSYSRLSDDSDEQVLEAGTITVCGLKARNGGRMLVRLCCVFYVLVAGFMLFFRDHIDSDKIVREYLFHGFAYLCVGLTVVVFAVVLIGTETNRRHPATAAWVAQCIYFFLFALPLLVIIISGLLKAVQCDRQEQTRTCQQQTRDTFSEDIIPYLISGSILVVPVGLCIYTTYLWRQALRLEVPVATSSPQLQLEHAAQPLVQVDYSQ